MLSIGQELLSWLLINNNRRIITIGMPTDVRSSGKVVIYKDVQSCWLIIDESK